MAPLAEGTPLARCLVLLHSLLLLLPRGVPCRGATRAPESPCHRAEHPLISHTEIEPWIHRFRSEGTVDYSQLTFDPGQNELIVGASGTGAEAEWHCDEFTKGACFSRGKSELTNLTEVHDQISGMARCPYNPLHNSTALITSSGELYAATAMDFSGRDPAIYRSLGGLPPLRTAQYNSKWLNGIV
ncbi:semaphorin-5B isoform X1 [Labeo rohita]|uniref:Semaphorin-5B isoform X1 n=1 Tax=Labeo rohita TaxID=84645 RepID=A0A498LLZ6_LABRO|nr:semaphorin-5B isoform X1 [Labeo rohita]